MGLQLLEQQHWTFVKLFHSYWTTEIYRKKDNFCSFNCSFPELFLAFWRFFLRILRTSWIVDGHIGLGTEFRTEKILRNTVDSELFPLFCGRKCPFRVTPSSSTFREFASIFCSIEWNSELFSLPRNGSEWNSKRLLLFLFHGMEFTVVPEWYRNAPMSDWESAYRNADAGGIGLDDVDHCPSVRLQALQGRQQPKKYRQLPVFAQVISKNRSKWQEGYF
jgi:hypothetical protein